jgi:hypothetical protein
MSKSPSAVIARKAILLVTIGATGCAACHKDVVVRPIPGTEQVAIETFNITISPDERWLTFVEWKFPRKVLRKHLPHDEYDCRVTSLDLQSGTRTEHAVESVSPAALGFSDSDRQWKYHAAFRLIKERFRPPGWRGKHFYFQRYGGAYVALDPRKSGVVVAAQPVAPGLCSDCPPMVTVQFHDRSWDLISKDVSAVVREGTVHAVYYISSPYQHNQADHRTIYRIAEAGTEQVVVEAPGKKGTHVIIEAIRASPNERYMAYVVDSKKQAFLSGSRNELFIRELASGREKRIAKYGYMGNLIWSPDSDRLYFAGGEYSSDSAVRIVDVAATFSH